MLPTFANWPRPPSAATRRWSAPISRRVFRRTFQDRLTLEAALHVSAAARGRAVLRVLPDCRLCNFLLRDKGGRLASELAYLFGQDPAAARLLGAKERQQAEAQEIKITRRPQQGKFIAE